ncbi:GNAT family N-acetyltransferase [Paenibacillus sp. GCM10027626]|uniref:GNAT family N-acetyltransferase n=1 Tax=Paenibacillus sp. GCM10027626 TaxID=3273411 RepID=UPI0036440615
MSLIIEMASIEDAESILALQKLAYRSEAELYNDFEIEPLVQSLEGIRQQFGDHVFLKALEDGIIIGSVRGKLVEGICHIGKLIVHPDYQNRGIGKQLMRELESYFNAARRYDLFTGHRSEKNLQLYMKQGYTPFKTTVIDDNLSLVYLYKTNGNSHL